jgi:peptidoglycan hydrolase CwlO-like protein
MDILYILDHETIVTLDQITGMYKNQGNWKAAMTKLIVSNVSKLEPGQMVQFAGRNFMAIGSDRDGDWHQQMDHPSTIQRVNEEVVNALKERSSARSYLEDTKRQLDEAQRRYDEAKRDFGKTQGSLDKLANKFGRIKV